MIQDFKTFIARGNVIDLAVGIIIGAAFTGIVNSLVNDLINPILGLLTGGIDFTDKYLLLSGSVPEGASLAVARQTGAAILAYGSFLMTVLNFLIVAWAVFLLVKGVNRIQSAAIRRQKVEEEAVPAGPSQEELLAQIRDLLADRANPV
ncbi:large conductance mechanosensitive channel protein MscL [Paracoccus sp. (in: a-proteobacteria)]|uniref:large conductance mechanosensitive channel protein MscL n=1 Tax=Paracoccus sp. TaxID=267 RepID=UPI00396CA5AF